MVVAMASEGGEWPLPGGVWLFVASIGVLVVCGAVALERWARGILDSFVRLQETEQYLRVLYGERIEEGRQAWLLYLRTCEAIGVPASWSAFIAREFAPLGARQERRAHGGNDGD
jgi:hypothetical protein